MTCQSLAWSSSRSPKLVSGDIDPAGQGNRETIDLPVEVVVHQGVLVAGTDRRRGSLVRTASWRCPSRVSTVSLAAPGGGIVGSTQASSPGPRANASLEGEAPGVTGKPRGDLTMTHAVEDVEVVLRQVPGLEEVRRTGDREICLGDHQPVVEGVVPCRIVITLAVLWIAVEVGATLVPGAAVGFDLVAWPQIPAVPGCC